VADRDFFHPLSALARIDQDIVSAPEIAKVVSGAPDTQRYVRGDNQSVTQTTEGRVRVTSEERLQGTLAELVDEVRKLRQTLEFIHGVSI